MKPELGEVYIAPVDYSDSDVTFRSLVDDRKLTRDDRVQTGETQYRVTREGKFRPVIVLGFEPETRLAVVVPVYSKNEKEFLLDHYENQKTEIRAKKRLFTTFVPIPKAEVKTRMRPSGQEKGLHGNSVARLDKLKSVSADALAECLGVVQGPRHELVLAGYVQIAYGPHMERIIRSVRPK